MNNENVKNIWHIRNIKREVPNSISNINVFGLFRNNEDTIGATLSGLKTATRRLNCEANYYIYENDSNDDTPNLIKEFYTHSKGLYSCEILGNKEHAGNSRPERLRDLAIYRNKMKELCKIWDNTEYSFIIDSEIKFSHDIMKKMIETITSDNNIAMVTPFGTPEFSDDYYDTFAYLDMQGGKEPPKTYEISEARTRFSGFVCIKQKYSNTANGIPLEIKVSISISAIWYVSTENNNRPINQSNLEKMKFYTINPTTEPTISRYKNLTKKV